MIRAYTDHDKNGSRIVVFDTNMTLAYPYKSDLSTGIGMALQKIKRLSVVFFVIMTGSIVNLTLAEPRNVPVNSTSGTASSKLPATPAGWEEFMTAGEILPEKTTLLGSATERANEMIFYALSHLGVRYKYGGDNPDKGFDCSGLVRWVFNRTWGIMLPRRSEQIADAGKEVSRDQLRPGDLVFFNTLRRAYSHVGIYLGDGRFLHAPSSGGQVRIESIDIPYWQQRWNGARRLDQPNDLSQ